VFAPLELVEVVVELAFAATGAALAFVGVAAVVDAAGAAFFGKGRPLSAPLVLVVPVVLVVFLTALAGAFLTDFVGLAGLAAGLAGFLADLAGAFLAGAFFDGTFFAGAFFDGAFFD
jgi:hypothetical protein